MNKQKNKTGTIDCGEAVRRFNSYIDNFIRGKAKDELLQHIENCRHCFDHLEFEKMLKNRVGTAFRLSGIEEKKAEKKVNKLLDKIYQK